MFLLQLWKRSGAWFFKGIPKYIIPSSKKSDGGLESSRSYGSPKARPETKATRGPGTPTSRNYNTWSRGGSGGRSKWSLIYMYSGPCLERPLNGPYKCGLWRQVVFGANVQLHWNVGPSARNIGSFKMCGLSWQWSLTRGFTVVWYRTCLFYDCKRFISDLHLETTCEVY